MGKGRLKAFSDGVLAIIITIIHHEGRSSRLAKAVGRDLKEKISLLLYLVAILFSFFYSWLAESIYVFVAVMWLITDRHIERILNEK